MPGEKLSKQQLHNSNIIKKLRAKDKENENTIAKLNKKVKDLEEDLQHLKQVNVNHSLNIYIITSYMAMVYKTFRIIYWGGNYHVGRIYQAINK